jgi:hypothetical protein
MSGEQELVLAELVTQNHRYSGAIELQGRRLADILSDARLDVLEVQQVTVTGAGARPTEIRCGQLLVKKQDVLLAMPQGAYEAPVRRRNNYRKKQRFGAMIVLGGYTLSGIVYLPARTKPWALIDPNSDLPNFFGLTDVTLHGSPSGLVPSRCDTAIIRRHAIEAMQLSAQPLPEPTAEEWRQAEAVV